MTTAPDKRAAKKKKKKLFNPNSPPIQSPSSPTNSQFAMFGIPPYPHPLWGRLALAVSLLHRAPSRLHQLSPSNPRLGRPAPAQNTTHRVERQAATLEGEWIGTVPRTRQAFLRDSTIPGSKQQMRCDGALAWHGAQSPRAEASCALSPSPCPHRQRPWHWHSDRPEAEMVCCLIDVAIRVDIIHYMVWHTDDR